MRLGGLVVTGGLEVLHRQSAKGSCKTKSACRKFDCYGTKVRTSLYDHSDLRVIPFLRQKQKLPPLARSRASAAMPTEAERCQLSKPISLHVRYFSLVPRTLPSFHKSHTTPLSMVQLLYCVGRTGAESSFHSNWITRKGCNAHGPVIRSKLSDIICLIPVSIILRRLGGEENGDNERRCMHE